MNTNYMYGLFTVKFMAIAMNPIMSV